MNKKQADKFVSDVVGWGMGFLTGLSLAVLHAPTVVVVTAGFIVYYLFSRNWYKLFYGD